MEKDEIPTIYVRHKMEVTRKILKQLWEDKVIALHWKNSPRTDPEYYRDVGRHAVKEMEYLNEFSKIGAIVGAYYGNMFPDLFKGKMIIGKIQPGSKIAPLWFGKLCYKTVQLKATKTITHADYPIFFTARPRRGWSICRWKNIAKQLRAVAEGDKLPFEVESLAPSQLEVACNEFLRLRDPEYCPLTPIGRTMRDVDIVGISGKTKILAQVTHKTIETKLEILKRHSSKDVSIMFFGPEEQRPSDDKLGHVDYVSIEEVFDELTSDIDSKTYNMICNMLSR